MYFFSTHLLLLHVILFLLLVADAASALRKSGNCKGVEQCTAKLVQLQADMDRISQQHAVRRDQLERNYTQKILELRAERNAHVRNVPGFFFHALVQKPRRAQRFLSSPQTRLAQHTLEYCGAGAMDHCVKSDVDFLMLYLNDVRCFHVPRDSYPSEDEEQQQQQHSATSQQQQQHHFRSGGESDIRIELGFAANNLFANKRLVRQVSSHFHTGGDFVARGEDEFASGFHHRHEFVDSRSKDEIREARKASAFGVGSELRWTGTRGRDVLLAPFLQRVNGSVAADPESFTFFALFDAAILEAAVSGTAAESWRRTMQHALAALVHAACNVEVRPIAAYESSKTAHDLYEKRSVNRVRSSSLEDL